MPYLLSCLTSLVVYVLPCLTRCVPYGLLCFTYLVLFVLLCPTCLMSYVFSCLMCLVLYVPLCLLHIMPCLPLCHTCLALYILSCLTRSRALFLASCMCQYHPFCSYVSAFHVTFHICILLIGFFGKIYYSQNRDNINVIILSDGQQ